MESMESEHGQTMISVLKTVFAPRRQLAPQMDPVRAQQVKSWAWRVEHVETWRDHADEGRISVRRRARATKSFFAVA